MSDWADATRATTNLDSLSGLLFRRKYRKSSISDVFAFTAIC